MLNLKFFGIGSAFNPLFGNNNAFFELDEDIYFIDFGESNFEKVYKNIDLCKYKNITVLITHMHADHIGSLPTFISYCYIKLKKTINIFHPNEDLKDFLHLCGISSNMFNYQKCFKNSKNLNIEFVDVSHAKDMPCYGLIISHDNKSIFYSGDSNSINKVILERFLNRTIETIYHDTSYENSSSHCYYKNIEELIPKHLRKNFYCMHLGCDFIQELKDLGFNIPSLIK